MPSFNCREYYSMFPKKYKVAKCKYCKGTNLKVASHGNFCCDCRKISDYKE